MGKTKGFTLIELTVVIAIMAILALLTVPNFIIVRQKGRDVQRKNDLKQLQKALELYKGDSQALDLNLQYPSNASYDSGQLILRGYIASMPHDPLSSPDYCYNRSSALEYTLCACLENPNDSSTAPNCYTASCPYTCTSNKYYKLTQP